MRRSAYLGRRAWHAPGRVNLIGEHTDYNGGLCLPIAVPFGLTATGSVRDDRVLRLTSASYPDQVVEVPLDELRPGGLGGWAAYAAGAVWAVGEAGVHLTGADIAIDGDLPAGAGLSSSAALTCATAAVATELAGADVSPDAVVAAARSAENDFVGVPTGGMDQTVVVHARAGHGLLIDNASGELRQVPLAGLGDAVLVVVDTGVSHSLADGQYAARRADCEQAAAELGVRTLREVKPGGLADALERLSGDRLRSRVRHVVTENDRVERFVAGIASGSDPAGLGDLMTASHVSLRDDYEVSCAELDATVDAALSAGALGARMTGGGFGGSAVALVHRDRVAAVTDAVAQAFQDAGWESPTVQVMAASDGLHRVALREER